MKKEINGQMGRIRARSAQPPIIITGVTAATVRTDMSKVSFIWKEENFYEHMDW